MNRIDLKGRKAIVTGGSGGIGLAVARRLLQSGATVTLWAPEAGRLRSARQALSTEGPVHEAVVDISDERAVAHATATTLETMGGVDILVNNAGVGGPHLPAWQWSTEDWLRVLAVNLTGTFFCCRALVPPMVAAGYGRIVNIASVAAKEGSPLMGGYAAAKAGVIALTKTLAKELATQGVLVNAVTPGPTRTDLFAHTPPEQMKAMLSRCPMQRLMEPEEVAASVAWLASADCSFTTGAVHDLSGGRSTY